MRHRPTESHSVCRGGLPPERRAPQRRNWQAPDADAYTPKMRAFRAPILLAVCLGLLAAQLSGMHTHVNAHGFHGAAQGTHDHHHHDGHDDDGDHDGDVDVDLVDYGLGASKLPLFVFALGFALLLLAPMRDAVSPHWIAPLPPPRRTRWRPPLRGPPSPHLVA